MKTKKIAARVCVKIAMIAFVGGAVGGCGTQNNLHTPVPSAVAPSSDAPSSAAAPVAKVADAKVVTATSDKKSASKDGIVWASSFEAARAEAKKQNKPLMIDFYTDWCGACKMLDAEIFPDAGVVKASRDFINVKVNAEKRTDIANQYGVTGFPTIVWIRADGVPVLRQEGVNAASSDFVAQMKSAQSRFAALQK